jgi:hypothetical protein
MGIINKERFEELSQTDQFERKYIDMLGQVRKK